MTHRFTACCIVLSFTSIVTKNLLFTSRPITTVRFLYITKIPPTSIYKPYILQNELTYEIEYFTFIFQLFINERTVLLLSEQLVYLLDRILVTDTTKKICKSQHHWNSKYSQGKNGKRNVPVSITAAGCSWGTFLSRRCTLVCAACRTRHCCSCWDRLASEKK